MIISYADVVPIVKGFKRMGVSFAIASIRLV